MSSTLTPRSSQPTRAEREATAKRSAMVVVGSVALTAVLFLVPALHMVAYPLLLLSTFVHEMGHGVAAMIVGGDFHRFELFADGSGVATMALPYSRFASAFTSFGGLVGPAIMGAILFAVGSSRKLAGPTLWVLTALTILSIVFYVRNVFGIAYVGGVGALLFLIARGQSEMLKQFTVVFLGAQLCLSVFSRGDYLFTQYADGTIGRMPSDVQQIADALFLPYWFWGGLIGLFSAATVAFGVWLSLRSIVNHAGDLPSAPSKRALR